MKQPVFEMSHTNFFRLNFVCDVFLVECRTNYANQDIIKALGQDSISKPNGGTSAHWISNKEDFVILKISFHHLPGCFVQVILECHPPMKIIMMMMMMMMMIDDWWWWRRRRRWWWFRTYFYSEWCIVGYGPGAFWDLCDWSILGILLIELNLASATVPLLRYSPTVQRVWHGLRVFSVRGYFRCINVFTQQNMSDSVCDKFRLVLSGNIDFTKTEPIFSSLAL